jgi:hypothetical protein
MAGMWMRRLRAIAPGLVAAAVLGGCVEREITITSEPEGALVHLNDQEVGRTPVDVPFTFYGTYDVRLEKAGYKPLWTEKRAKAPWWEYPGPDLVAEAVPGARSNPQWHFDLSQATPPGERDPQKLLDNANEMRRKLRGEGSSESE